MENKNSSGGEVSSGVFRRVLVGFDGSNEARHALRVARSLAADLDGDVHVLSVIEPRAHAETPEERQAAREDEREILSQGLDAEQGTDGRNKVPVSHVVYGDNPATVLVEFAKEHGFDLVVVGTHGRDRMMHRGVGRSLEVLIRNHTCPVLVV